MVSPLIQTLAFACSCFLFLIAWKLECATSLTAAFRSAWMKYASGLWDSVGPSCMSIAARAATRLSLSSQGMRAPEMMRSDHSTNSFCPMGRGLGSCIWPRIVFFDVDWVLVVGFSLKIHHNVAYPTPAESRTIRSIILPPFVLPAVGLPVGVACPLR